MEKTDLEPNELFMLKLIAIHPNAKRTEQAIRLLSNLLASYGLVESLSNSRYEITDKGKELLKVKN
jgi:predicted transcriptional regulator